MQQWASNQEQLTEDKFAAGPCCVSCRHWQSRLSGHCTATGRRVQHALSAVSDMDRWSPPMHVGAHLMSNLYRISCCRVWGSLPRNGAGHLR